MSVGQNNKHDSAHLHVQGSATYVDDRPLLTQTHFIAVGFHPTCSHGEIVRLDLADVLTSEGVIDAFSFNDLPAATDISPVFTGDELLANNLIHYYRQPLFVVVAKSARLALIARDKAVIKVNELVPILDAQVAIDNDQTVGIKRTIERGSLDKDHATAQGRLFIGAQEHFYLEGQAAEAQSEDDQVIIYSSTQHPSELQHLVAKVLGLQNHRVLVETRRMGGAFGGKESQGAQWACLAAVAMQRNKVPIRCTLPRGDDMVLTGKRHPFTMDYTITANAQGIIQSATFNLIGHCGYSADLSNAVIDRAMFHADNAYYYPNTKIIGQRARTNTVSHTAFRGFGGPQGMLGAEVAMDALARALHLDPLDIRKRNLYRQGADKTPYEQPVFYQSLQRVIEQLETNCHYHERRKRIRTFNAENQRFKRGLALTPVKFGISFTVSHLNQAGALVHIYNDGTVHLNHGGTEMGQGLNIKVAQIVASTLGIAIERIAISATRTDKVPNTSPTAASSGSDLNGHAARNAALTLKSRLIEFLAEHFSSPHEAIELSDDVVKIGNDSFGFSEVARLAYHARVSLSATGFYKTPDIHYDPEKGKGHPFYYFANGAACSEVIIDTHTGEMRCLAVDIVHDVGTSLNPAIDIGQIQGGFVQGMGWLTNEEIQWDETGRLISNSPSTYKIPAISDIPSHFNVTLLEHPNEVETPYFSKAVGEPPLMLAISVFCAINDAIASIADYRVQPQLDAPATSEAIFNAIEAIKES